MQVDVVTIFPEYFGPLDVSLLGKARERGLVDVRVHDLRAHTSDVHRTVDDTPFGGGPGMVMKPEPWYAALQAVVDGGGPAGAERPRVVVPTPSGRPLTQSLVAELAAESWLAIPCGRYEGIDRRVLDRWADDEVSLGDYVLAGGEVAALVLIEAVTRLIPGVVGNADSVADDSHTTGLLEGPVYTRPASYDGRDVPPVLLSGDHAAITRWRRDEALRRTAAHRPGLLDRAELSERDRAALETGFPPGSGAVAD
ncbi:MAG TPA: tRNA (guanosine(37)-N1)-methyltransferase TrmD [Mycobacteriales bacterium]|nr:tRNA (guanosine(37)-N1)-methyltransferase TrmD [Mycobacteriales bacterium]